MHCTEKGTEQAGEGALECRFRRESMAAPRAPFSAPSSAACSSGMQGIWLVHGTMVGGGFGGACDTKRQLRLTVACSPADKALHPPFAAIVCLQ